MIFGTVFSRRDLARVRVLAESVAIHHPGAEFVTVAVDTGNRPLSALKERFIQVEPAELFDTPDEFFRLALSLPRDVLVQALQPRLARHLIARNVGPVVMLAPDVYVLSPMDELVELASSHDLVVVPRSRKPVPDDGRTPTAMDVAALGALDPGIYAASPGADRALALIAEQTPHAAADARSGVQRRVWDGVLGYADVWLLAHAGYGLAFWNLHEGTLERSADDWQFERKPVRCIRLPDFDPDTPYLLSTAQGKRPRVLLSEHAGLAELCGSYAQKLIENAHGVFADDLYLYGRLSGGTVIDAHMRRAYREALTQDKGVPPNPFVSGDERAFMNWLRLPVDESGDQRISHYLYAVWQNRSDLQAAFPRPLDNDAEPFIGWVLGAARQQEAVPPQLMPEPESGAHPPVAMPTELRPGLNLVGYLRAGFGVGEASRLVVAGLEASGLEYAAITAGDVSVSHVAEFDHAGETAAVFDTNLICVNVDWLERFAESVGPDFFSNRRSIGVWWWEGDTLPDELAKNDRHLDEIWVGSSFVQKTVQKTTDLPVFVMPLHVPTPVVEGLPGRAELGLPEGFMFLFQFDFNSTTARKNPVGLIDAYLHAFQPEDGAFLIMKSVHGDEYTADLERLRAKAAGRPDIQIIDRYLPALERDGLMQACDCYVSLHRSEGFGLTMAEAMARGKPVIATGYSGNLDFMNNENSYLVPHRLTTLMRDAGPYPAGTTWADPDLGFAAKIMREVFEDRDRAQIRAARGQTDIREHRTIEALATFLSDRFEELSGAASPGERDETPGMPAAAMPPPESALAALRFVQQGPSASTLSTARLGSLGKALKRMLLALTRPATVVQSEFNRYVASGLVQTVEMSSARFDQVGSDHHQVAARVTVLEDEVAGRITSDRNLLQALSAQIRSQDHMLREMVSRVTEIENAHSSLEDQLCARPYLAHPELLTTVDDAARPTIGYRGASAIAGISLYREFEEMFRGPEDRVRELQKPYVEMLRGRGKVLDIGCGRGEMLDLLADAGLSAIGIDIDPGMIERCREKGHVVHQGDAREYLSAQPPGAFGAIFCAQVIEHIPYSELVGLLEAASSVLPVGGRLVAETVNPHSLAALKTFWTDLTHQHPISPEVAVTLARLSGFSAAWIHFPEHRGSLDLSLRDCNSYALVAERGQHASA